MQPQIICFVVVLVLRNHLKLLLLLTFCNDNRITKTETRRNIASGRDDYMTSSRRPGKGLPGIQTEKPSRSPKVKSATSKKGFPFPTFGECVMSMREWTLM